MCPSRISDTTRGHARRLRRDQTGGERKLWRLLRNLKHDDLHARRQAPVGPYIADFVIFSRKLVIEIDGDLHSQPEQHSHDEKRDAWMRSEGFDVLRYAASEVHENAESIYLHIRNHLGLEIG